MNELDYDDMEPNESMDPIQTCTKIGYQGESKFSWGDVIRCIVQEAMDCIVQQMKSYEYVSKRSLLITMK